MWFSNIFRKTLDWLFVRNVAEIAPLDNIQLKNGGYKWNNQDPQFGLKFLRPISFTGFYMLEIRVSEKSDRVMRSQLYWNNGKKGYSQENSLIIPIRTSIITKRIVWFDCAKNIRWDPSLEPGSLLGLSVKITKLSKSFARDRMLRKIRGHQSPIGKKNVPLKDLYNIYDSRFSIHENKNGDYGVWCLNVESETTLLDKALEGIKISIILPVYNPDPYYLRLCIESVLSQTYENWELCIADDASDSKSGVIAMLKDFEAQDKRIKVNFREINGHISRASNSALELSSGDYALLLDHDDILVKTALNEVVTQVLSNNNLALIYSDEDKIDDKGRRFQPHFKPDFSPDLLLSQNYISHISVLSMDFIKRVGGFRVGYEGSQDHDLLLRCLPYLNEKNVVHIPKVLYHWRAIEGSTALDSNEKNYTETAGLKALTSYADKHTAGAKASLAEGANTYRLNWPIVGDPLVSLLIPTRDGLNVLRPCIDSIIEKTEYQNFEIIILNNDSSEIETLKYLEVLKNHKKISVVDTPGEFNYSKINNIGVEVSSGTVIGLINNDIEVIDGGWLTEMLSHALRPEIGCVGAKLLYANGSIQHGGVILGMGGVANHSHLNQDGNGAGYFERMRTVHNVSAVTGACLLVEKSIYESVGGLNEDFLKIAFNDVDFCLKVRVKGYRNLFTPFAKLYHHESVTRGFDITPEKRKRFDTEVSYMKSKWGEALISDPYYNVNFDLRPGVESYTLNISNSCLK